jgi:hypothetical protein
MQDVIVDTTGALYAAGQSAIGKTAHRLTVPIAFMPAHRRWPKRAPGRITPPVRGRYGPKAQDREQRDRYGQQRRKRHRHPPGGAGPNAGTAPRFCNLHYKHSDTSVSMTWITVRWGPVAPSTAFCVLRSFVASRRRGPRQRVTREGEHERKGRDPHHTADQLLAARRPQRLLRPVTTRLVAHLAIWNRLLSGDEIASIWSDGASDLRTCAMYHSFV